MVRRYGDGVRLITRGRDLATLVADALVEESVRPQTRTLSFADLGLECPAYGPPDGAFVIDYECGGALERAYSSHGTGRRISATGAVLSRSGVATTKFEVGVGQHSRF
jgi:hypothetical protein